MVDVLGRPSAARLVSVVVLSLGGLVGCGGADASVARSATTNVPTTVASTTATTTTTPATTTTTATTTTLAPPTTISAAQLFRTLRPEFIRRVERVCCVHVIQAELQPGPAADAPGKLVIRYETDVRTPYGHTGNYAMDQELFNVALSLAEDWAWRFDLQIDAVDPTGVDRGVSCYASVMTRLKNRDISTPEWFAACRPGHSNAYVTR